jgi:hypothetical protein
VQAAIFALVLRGGITHVGHIYVLFVHVLIHYLDEGMRRVHQRRRNEQVTERKVIMVHEYEGMGSPKGAPSGRLWRRGHGVDEVVGVATRTKFDDTESDELIPLDGIVDIGAVEIS